MNGLSKHTNNMPEPYPASNTILPEDRPLRAKRKLNILIVGAGIAGLTVAIGIPAPDPKFLLFATAPKLLVPLLLPALDILALYLSYLPFINLSPPIGLKLSGHKVTVLEKVAEIKDVGAGIQIAPNSARIFRRFGLLERMLKLGTVLTGNSIRKFDTNEECSHAPFDPEVSPTMMPLVYRASPISRLTLSRLIQKYGAPLFVMHRGDLQRLLLDIAHEVKVNVRLSAPVTAIDDDFEAKLWLASGEVLKGDLILAADGIKSRIRTLVAEKHGVKNRSWSSGDAVYRLMVPLDAMESDEEALKEYMGKDVGMRWMGPGSHLMSYPVRKNTVYNMVSCPSVTHDRVELKHN